MIDNQKAIDMINAALIIDYEVPDGLNIDVSADGSLWILNSCRPYRPITTNFCTPY
jgi:hypothetical protein